MENETRMTEEMIKALTEKFSLATVFILEMPRMNIKEIASLEKCENMLHLNLSNNAISRIRGLQKCVALEWLNLSGNQIS